MKKKMKGIIFDMDNTILSSNIDFKIMKQKTFQYLVAKHILPPEFDVTIHTTSTLVEEALKTGRMNEEMIREMWDIITEIEKSGMHNAKLEPGALALLNELRRTYEMVIVTNNSYEAAVLALSDNHILNHFAHVVGREQMGSLKPAPDGFLYVLNKYKEIPAEEWLSIGDSWIDGAASAEAGISFLSYQAELDMMNKKGVFPLAVIQDLRELPDYL